jgi:hypothetical protein
MSGRKADIAADFVAEYQAPARKQHPTLSDVALALATRRSDPLSKVSLSLNAKGDVQIEVDVTDADPKIAAEKAANLFDVLRTSYPRANGA